MQIFGGIAALALAVGLGRRRYGAPLQALPDLYNAEGAEALLRSIADLASTSNPR
ncbi:hypothetical protein [Pyrobaculum sp.]|uniref:hypothetical protein n=1 Tax=Pyrobaculum sp. TaxID=2004705 RepID=UPI0031660A9E